MPFELVQRDLQAASSSQTTSGAVNFQQQGSVDWTALGSNSLHASVQVLSRISAAGIDPFTIVMGQAVCGALVWGSEGRKRFDQALQKCRGLAGYRNILWFGFGVKHVASILTSTEQGATCAALCSCLAECYGSDLAANIILEMTKASKPTIDTVPSLVQWRNLINACAGLVTASTFGIRAEQLMRLAGQSRIAPNERSGELDTWRNYRGVAHRTEIAETLLGLAKLSRGVLVQMTIIGGADAGFIATIADWLLDLSVEIRGGKDYETLWKNRSLEEKPQLLIIYERNMSKDSMQPVGQTYHLPDGYQIVRRTDGNQQTSILSGRVPWEKALEYTFGRDFNDLMATKDDFGIAIGNAARIYQGLYEGDENIQPQWLANCHSYFPDSHGLAYAHFILMRFPELEPLRDSVFRGARTSGVTEAGGSFVTHMSAIATVCRCGTCRSKEAGTTGRAFCLTLLAQTIIRTCRALSGMETELCPLRAGLEMMFWKAIDYKHPATAQENLIEDDEYEWHSIAGTMTLLKCADILFGASRMEIGRALEDWVCARADNGLCYFFDILINPSFGAGTAAKVHIINGRIEHEGRAFNMLSDMDAKTPPSGGPSYRARVQPRFLDIHLSELARCYGCQLSVLVTQRLDGLELEYALSKDSTILLSFGPARAIHTMCCNEGLVSCGRNPECPKPPELEDLEKEIVDCRASQKPICHLKDGEDEMLLIQGDINIRLAAAARTWDPIIQRDECLACCVRYGVKNGGKRITIILDPQYVSSLKNID